jgi:ribonuclease HI
MYALWAGLKGAITNHNTTQTQITVTSDSQFVQRLLMTQYLSKKFQQKSIYIHSLLASSLQKAIVHVRRQWNTMSDSNKAMDTRTTGNLSMFQLQQVLSRNDHQR